CFAVRRSRVSAIEAKSHVGERAEVCGKVAGARYAKSAKGQPTFLNLDEPYPKPVFTTLIWEATAPTFESRIRSFKVSLCALQARSRASEVKPRWSQAIRIRSKVRSKTA